MTIIEGIEAVAKWLEDEALPGIELYQPVDKPATAPEPRRTAPTVHRMYIPPASLKDTSEMWPGIMVALAAGKDHMRSQERMWRFSLTLVVWNPGEWEDCQLRRNSNGWRELWNMADVVLRKLHRAETIGDRMRVDYGEGIEYGPLLDGDGAIMDLYPLFAAHIDFACKAVGPSASAIDEYL